MIIVENDFALWKWIRSSTNSSFVQQVSSIYLATIHFYWLHIDCILMTNGWMDDRRGDTERTACEEFYYTKKGASAILTIFDLQRFGPLYAKLLLIFNLNTPKLEGF